jgi:hypothetical protein
MSKNVTFTDNTAKVYAALDEAIIQLLTESGQLVQRNTVRNTPVDKGQLKGSWDYIVDEDEQSVTIGSPLENAIWNEYGTGEFAAKGNGRKGGWVYRDAEGNYYHTKGKKPRRSLEKGVDASKSAIQERAKEIMKGG